MDNLIDDVLIQIGIKVKSVDLLSFCLTEKRIYQLLYISKKFWYNYFKYNGINLSEQIKLVINSNKFSLLPDILNIIKKIKNTKSAKKRIDQFIICYDKDYKNVCEFLINKYPLVFSTPRIQKWVKKIPNKYDNIVENVKKVFFNLVDEENKKFINQFHITLINNNNAISFDDNAKDIYELDIHTNILDLFNNVDEIEVTFLYEYDTNHNGIIVNFNNQAFKMPFKDYMFENDTIKNKLHVKYIEKYFRKELNKLIKEFPFVKTSVVENGRYRFIDVCIMKSTAFERNYFTEYSNSSDDDCDDSEEYSEN